MRSVSTAPPPIFVAITPSAPKTSLARRAARWALRCFLYDRNRGDGDDDAGKPEVPLVAPIKLLDDRMVLGEIGEGGIRKHERPVEDFIRMNDRRQESLNVAAVKNRLLLMRRMLLRVDREDIADARQIFWPVVESGWRQLVDLRFVGNHFLCRGSQVYRRSQPRFLYCQAVLIHVGAFCRVGDEHDVVGRAEGRISPSPVRSYQ